MISFSGITFIGLGGFLFGNFQDVSLKEIPAQIKVGDYAYFQFRNLTTNEETKVAVSVEEYDRNSLKDSVKPVLQGYEYRGGYKGEIYDYPILKDNEYYKVGVDVASSTLVRVKKAGQEEIVREQDL